MFGIGRGVHKAGRDGIVADRGEAVRIGVARIGEQNIFPAGVKRRPVEVVSHRQEAAGLIGKGRLEAVHGTPAGRGNWPKLDSETASLTF